MPKLTKRAVRYGHTDGRTDPNYRKASLLKMTKKTSVQLNIDSNDGILTSFHVKHPWTPKHLIAQPLSRKHTENNC